LRLAAIGMRFGQQGSRFEAKDRGLTFFNATVRLHSLVIWPLALCSPEGTMPDIPVQWVFALFC
jgi:hypothetical protein